ncbi:NupC/NupG family nucleoside CNT transporter [Desulfovibrio ferrophilus]|uniref:Na+ dependent nucleoside transporter n=1 Tax=Desulfovibrio ferrophilus TaxID=241368 RepID=A0A2Z6B3I5_9BACT|nr:nucleoside transporter C-terminal domain-containing protein [Desulfovibrio ferrophilus]BBD09986.1 Na+ dependent nucleoside transporter [Desulfovibrio ferrophilus]
MLQGLLGLFAFISLAWIFSENRRAVRPGLIATGLGLQFGVGLLLLKVPGAQHVFIFLNHAVEILDKATTAGTSFVFGYLGGGTLPFAEPWPGAAFIFALKALPIIIVMSALSSLLFYWNIIPAVVRFFSLILQRTMHIGGALGVGTASNIFVGMVEAPLLIRPYLLNMTRSELFALMTCGMATVAGTVLVLYAQIIAPVVPGAMGHILAASLMSAPASIMLAMIVIPENADSTQGDIASPDNAISSMDAVTKGTASGVQLLINVIGLLIVLVSIVSLTNQILGLIPDVANAPLTLERLLGWVMSPLVWLAGVPWAEATTAGTLMGTKTILNEFLAYLALAATSPEALSEKSRVIMTYAMCGFANPGSLGIMIAGLGTMVPERREEIVSLGIKSVAVGTLATLMTGAVVSLLY